MSEVVPARVKLNLGSMQETVQETLPNSTILDIDNRFKLIILIYNADSRWKYVNQPVKETTLLKMMIVWFTNILCDEVKMKNIPEIITNITVAETALVPFSTHVSALSMWINYPYIERELNIRYIIITTDQHLGPYDCIHMLSTHDGNDCTIGPSIISGDCPYYGK